MLPLPKMNFFGEVIYSYCSLVRYFGINPWMKVQHVVFVKKILDVLLCDV